MSKAITIFCFVVLVVVLVFADEEDAESTEVGSRHKRDAGCSRMMFEKARACCKLPQMFAASSMTQCSNLTSSIFAMRMAKMNKRFQMRKQAAKTKRHAGSMGPGGRKEDKFICIMKAEKLIKESGELDIDLFTTKFKANSSSTWQDVYSTGLTDCQAQMDSATIETPSMPNPAYNPKTMMLLKCIRKSLLMNCPAESVSEDPTCPASLSALSTCNPFKPKAFRTFMGMGTRGFNPAMGPGGPPPMQGPDDRIFIMPPKPIMGEDGQLISPQIMPMGRPYPMEGHLHGMPMDPSAVMPISAPEQMDPAVAQTEQKPTIRRQRTRTG